ncbi:unnamed protein product [Polarella glacialis]|uniref:thioredoxin-dependent peroxiredoxin n=1 Tax=Polarella glacialis TaxID=89957 RepID=A0A813FK84_POLGL|nr:unnamed protein product [Polarella glacialis]
MAAASRFVGAPGSSGLWGDEQRRRPPPARGSGRLRSRRPLVLTLGGLLVSAAAGLLAQAAVQAFVSPRSEEAVSRSSIRNLLVPAVFTELATSSLLGMPEEARAQPIPLEYELKYDGSMGDDVTFGGGGASISTQKQYNARVLAVMPGGIAEKAGVHVGDELMGMAKGNEMVDEGYLRQYPYVDGTVKAFATTTFRNGIKVKPGLYLQLRKMKMVQPGEVAPDFKLPSSKGGEVGLTDLLAGGKENLVVFFRPGSRFTGGDVQELRAYAKCQSVLEELGASVVSISMDPRAISASQAKFCKADFPLLSDVTGTVSKSYGSFITLDLLGESVDRKTYIIGKDGKVKAVFPFVGFDGTKDEIAFHLGQVALALGGDPKIAIQKVQPRQKTVGDMLAVLGVNVPKDPKSPVVR